jgi:parallel beta-helix repeat protein
MSVTPSFAIDNVKKSPIPIISGNTLYVGGTGPGNYTKIQDAIDNASDGDTVFVYDEGSPYYENVIVNKSINLIGENKVTTIINGSYNGDVVNVSADWVNISGFTIRNSRDAWELIGIKILSNNNTITGNDISNIIHGDGVYLDYSRGNTITDNIFLGNCHSICLSFSSDNNIMGNKISNNWLFSSIYLISSSGNTITGNDISKSEGGGIHLFRSSDNNIIGNTIISNGYGITIQHSSSNIITDNNISNNKYRGIYLGNTSDNIITGNTINSNTNYGIICLDYSTGNTITGNDISNNEDGIILAFSSSNTITGNTISSNTNYGICLETSTGNNITGNTMVGGGIFIWGYMLEYWNTNVIDTSNTLNGKPVFHCKNQIGGIIPAGAGQVILANCSGVVVEKQSISGGHVGIELGFSSGCTITGNTISNNLYGIYLFVSSFNNVIYHNNFIENRYNAYGVGNNTWDDGEYGNYWSNYKIKYPDAKRIWLKGIWDTPYEIPISGGNNKDNCPLIWKWTNTRTRATSYLWFLERFPLLERLLGWIR